MTAMTNILLKDDAGTPAETIFTPVTDTPHPLWRGTVAAVPFEGQPTIQIMANDLQKDGSYRRVLKVSVPIMEVPTVAGDTAGYAAAPKVAYVETFVITQYSSGRSTSDDRANALKMAIGAVAGASSTTGTGTLDGASAGNAWKNSTSPFPRLFIWGENQF